MKHLFFSSKNTRGFTLLEILLVIAMIAILAGIVILAINPAKQLAEARNAQRRSDVNAIMNAVYQYLIDTGSLPPSIGLQGQEICRTDIGAFCQNLVDLSILTVDQKYLTVLPRDPNPNSNCANEANSTCYLIVKNEFGHVTVSAPYAENGATIYITR